MLIRRPSSRHSRILIKRGKSTGWFLLGIKLIQRIKEKSADQQRKGLRELLGFAQGIREEGEEEKEAYKYQTRKMKKRIFSTTTEPKRKRVKP